MNKKRCFVISPIGSAGSDVRKHADDVLECIVKPALEECDVAPVRADQMDDPGRITDHMIRAILEYDMCIAVLTGHNPNVFYELAIAQAAARPVVLLIHKGEIIPFDVKDYRVVEYDLEAREIFNRTWVRQVVAHIKKVLSDKFAPPGLLGASLLGTSDKQKYWINRTSKEFGTAPRFVDVVSKTSARCDLMGISLKSWSQRASREGLLRVANAGSSLRILLLHEDHPSLEHMVNQALPGQDLNSIRTQIIGMYDYFSNLATEHPNLEVLKLRRGLMHFQLILTDNEALCLQYFFSRSGSDSPLLQYPAGSSLYDAVSEEFNNLWSLNS